MQIRRLNTQLRIEQRKAQQATRAAAASAKQIARAQSQAELAQAVVERAERARAEAEIAIGAEELQRIATKSEVTPPAPPIPSSEVAVIICTIKTPAWAEPVMVCACSLASWRVDPCPSSTAYQPQHSCIHMAASILNRAERSMCKHGASFLR
jgi:hypothetical protein